MRPNFARNLIVYHEKGRYGGWPANSGIWSWGDEILVGFTRGYHKEKIGHTIDPDRPREGIFARSLDGGENWSVEYGNRIRLPQPDPDSSSSTEDAGEVSGLTEPMDFSHPDFALTARLIDNHVGPSYIFHSRDRGRNWEGPFRLPEMGTKGIAARTDYLIDGRRSLHMFLTAAKSDGYEGRPFCARTTDGGVTWEKLSWIGPEPPGYSIMPSSVRLSPKVIVVVVRRKENSEWGRVGWLTSYISKDNGHSWSFLGNPTEYMGTNPPALIKLEDGRLCLNYGVRVEPYRICARLSSDQGKSWGDEIVLRDDGASGDLGYCRSVQRPDGKVVTIYYYNDPVTGPERYIGATIWNPGG